MDNLLCHISFQIWREFMNQASEVTHKDKYKVVGVLGKVTY